MGSVCSQEVLKSLKSEVARSFSGSVVNSSCIAEPLRCDPNRGQRRVRQGAVPPRCDPTCGQLFFYVFESWWWRCYASQPQVRLSGYLWFFAEVVPLECFERSWCCVWLSGFFWFFARYVLSECFKGCWPLLDLNVEDSKRCASESLPPARRAQAVAWCLLAVVLVLVVLSLPLRCLRPGSVVIRHSPRCLFVACLHLNVSRMCLALSQVS